MPDSINLRTDREPGEYIESQDVNQIAQAVNHLAANIGGGGTTDHRDLTNRDALNQHPINAITNLSATLANKSNLDHNHSISGVVGLQAELDNKAEATHNHNIGDVSNLWETLSGKANAGHTHDDRYYTEAEADGRFVRTVNNTGPDENGNVTVPSGGGGATDHGALTGLSDDDHPQYALADGTRGSFAAANHSHAISGVTGLQAALDGKADAAQTINARTTTYTLVSGDAGKVVTVASSSARTLTVPASVFTAGQRVDVLRRGSGALTIAAGPGMTLNGTPSLVLREQWSAASVLFLSATEGVVIGDLATP